MKEHPIIFSTPMIQALLAGRKTQTRRFATTPLRKVKVGDRLWVRENFAYEDASACLGDSIYVRYNADDNFIRLFPYDLPTKLGNKSSIHMPRWASRITLTVTDVRFQRLQDISEEDAEEEGIWWEHNLGWTFNGEEGNTDNPSSEYAELWDSLHGVGSWDANPEVVALTFDVEVMK